MMNLFKSVAVSICIVPHRLLCYNLGSQLVALLGEVLKALGGGVKLDEVCHWGSLVVSCPASFSVPVCFLTDMC
jgi:hypothetical protein